MRILFVFAHSGLTRHLRRVMELAALDGHSVYVTVGKEKQGVTPQPVLALRDFPNVHEAKFVSARGRRSRILRGTRAILDYTRYFRPDHPSADLAHRYHKIMSPRLFATLRRPLGLRVACSPPAQYLLRATERAIPADGGVCQELKSLKPDVVVATPYLFPDSADIDYLKAAASLGIPTCAVIASWDNLSTKGTAQVAVDRLFLWNEALKEEACSLHGIDPAVMAISGAPTFDYLFRWAPRITRDSFCQQAGIPSDRPILLYLCSSGSISDTEPRLVLRLAESLAANATTSGCVLVARPHPLNLKPWTKMKRLPANVRLFPDRSELPDDPQSVDNYCHSMHFARAVVGLNTSAFLEACVLDRPVISLSGLEDRRNQVRFGHFRHLVNGRFLLTPGTLEAAAQMLGAIVAGEDRQREARRAFVASFIRPAGLGREASAVMLSGIVAAGRAAARARSMRTFFGWRLSPGPARPARRTRRLSVVYVLLGLAHFPYHESVISALCRAGIEVHLVLLKRGSAKREEGDEEAGRSAVAELLQMFQEFIAAHGRMLKTPQLAKAESRVPELSRAIRFLRSYASYVRRCPPDNYYRRRWRGYMPGVLQRIVDNPFVLRAIQAPVAERLLGLADRLYPPPRAVLARLRSLAPDMVFVSPGNMRYNAEVEWLKAARWRRITSAVVMLSWDNLTTKGLVHVRPDYFFTWSPSHAAEARTIHSLPDEAVFVAGAPFFDKWHHADRLLQDRRAFCAETGLDPERPYVVYLGSSSNIADDESWLIRELYAAMAGASDARLREVQLLVRPHPGNRKICAGVSDLPVITAHDDHVGIPFSDDRKRILYNTLRHCLLTVSLNTSAIIDAVAIDTPCVSVRTSRYHDTHVGSAHFRHLLDAGAVLMADGTAGCVELIGQHLLGEDPSRKARREFCDEFIRGRLPGTDAGETIAWITREILEGHTANDIKRRMKVARLTTDGDEEAPPTPPPGA
jgi:hypothetical protein